jgi:hypothetical protein
MESRLHECHPARKPLPIRADHRRGEVGIEVRDSEKKVDSITTAVTVAEMKSEFAITRTMALPLCEGVSNGSLRGEVLRTVAFVIISSDHLTWGADELLGKIIWDWSWPEVNYPLTPENMARCRNWLQGTES